MRKARELDGLPILTFDTGKKVGEVKDILFSPEHRQVLAFLVDEGGWFEEARVIPFKSATSIGPDAIVVPHADVEIRVSQDPEVKSALDSRRTVTGMKVYSQDGRYLGTINDVIVNEKTGEVTGYEVTGGFLEEVRRGKQFMPSPATLTIGEQVVFVSNEVADEMEQQVSGGVTKTVQEAKRTGAAYVGEAGEQAKAVTQKAAISAKEQQKKFVIGKTARSEVMAPDGTTVVMPGQTITPEIADEADRKGVLANLVSVVGGAEAQSFLARLQEEAARAYEEAKRTVTGASERSKEEAERKRIDEALGRPVTRVILDRQDRVVLNTGEIITHKAIAEARDAGVLDILLNSVSKQEPSLGYEQRKAPVPGEARIEQHPQPRA